ncbi:hypothetical protein JY651_37670 [Pyxidicoccus parkwayensis]|uniref:Uncharacterized protein n=1 Tax=Pyxidicoccus parkwayensis TaxID=2813578 RepID=A0ABX7NU43_9BACT|nr:hypothetical protein [Pyxidicoccus parkwaysis]QSQ20911.1 hypothetical protein JY651_37670 [Pyxidicoccus parkwaysis]
MELLTAVPVAKLVYSAILVGLCYLLVSELHTLWFDPRLYIGRFDYFDTGEEKEADARVFALQVAHHHRTLLHLFAQEEEQRTPREQKPVTMASVTGAGAGPQPENTWWPHEVVPINNASSELSKVEITVQGINVKEILSKIRQWVSTPNEVTGTVEKGSGGVRAAANWPKGPSRASGQLVDGQLLIVDGQPDASRAAFHVACSLIWAQAAGKQQNLSRVPRTEFCGWADGWSNYVTLRNKSATLGGLEAADLDALKKLRTFLDRLVASAASYPEVYRLRADLIDLLPTDQKTEEDLALAQNDRTKYALLIAPKETAATGPTLVARASQSEELAVRAQGRPALRVRDGKLVDTPSETWQRMLSPAADQISSVSRATGSLVRRGAPGEREMHLTGFAVAPNVIMTVGDGFPPELLTQNTPAALSLSSWEFSFDDAPAAGTHGHSANPLPVTQVLFAAHGPPKSNFSFVLLEISGHDTTKNPPVTLESKAADMDTVAGQYVYVLGYPSEDPSLPSAFRSALLGPELEAHTKRLMPGRILSASPVETSQHLPLRQLVSDVSTMLGVAGGPLVELRSGHVVGLHFGGRWEDRQGKFAYALYMPDLLALLPQDVSQKVSPQVATNGVP